MLYALSVVTWPNWKDLRKNSVSSQSAQPPAKSNVLNANDLSLEKQMTMLLKAEFLLPPV